MIYLIQLALSILFNLLQVPINIAYFMNTLCNKIVRNFINSTDAKIRILSTSILCYLEPRLALDQYHLDLKNKDVEFMIDLVVTSVSEFSIIFHPVALLRALHTIIKLSEITAQKFVSQGLVPVLSKLIAVCDCAIQKEVILILWMLASYSTCMTTIKSESNLLKLIGSFHTHDDPHLVTAHMCALWDINEQLKGMLTIIIISYLSTLISIATHAVLSGSLPSKPFKCCDVE